jgi:hypothetical protein
MHKEQLKRRLNNLGIQVVGNYIKKKDIIKLVKAEEGWNKKTLDSYLETMLWSSLDDDGSPLDGSKAIIDISDEVINSSKKDIESFYEKAEKENIEVTKYTAEDIGHDFWLTRCGHGAGFWDGDYEEEDGEALTKISKEFGNKEPYIGDDGKVYLM